MTPLAGTVAIVTGAGAGLGRSHALALATAGAVVVVNDVVGTSAEQLCGDITALGGRALPHTGSVAEEEQVDGLVAFAVERLGRLDVVVNNAGIVRDGGATRMSTPAFDDVVGVHLRGAFLLSRAAWPHLRASGRGRLVHTTSTAGLFGNPGQANYSAAKMGLVGLSRTLSLEGARHGITSNAVAPLARTAMLGDLVARADLLDPEHVSRLVVALADERCTISGEVFSVVGRRYARVFVGLTAGWVAPPDATPDDVLTHLADVQETTTFTVPRQARDEVDTTVELLSNLSG